MSDQTVTIEDVIAFVREQHRIRPKVSITADSLLEADLGITGDDGYELLQAAERCFEISFSEDGKELRRAFGLADNEYLFHSEGVWLPWHTENVHPLSVGRLHQVIVERQQSRNW